MRNLLLSLFLFCTFQLLSQSIYKPNHRFFEVGFLFGGANYSGDVAEKNFYLSETQPGYGAYARYFFSSHFAGRTHLFFGTISGDDANAKNAALQRRSFRFGTDIFEFGLGGEWHILGRGQFSNARHRHYFLSPYIYLGVGGTSSGAIVEYYGKADDRKLFLMVPIPEVGLRQHFLIVPMGIGIRTELNESLVLGGELGWRPVFSDDLDGVKLNGNPNNNDWYYYGGATLSFILNTPKKRRH